MQPTSPRTGPAPDFTRATSVAPGGEIEQAIDLAFQYHPWNPDETKHGDAVREALASAVKVIVANVPPSPDRSAAIRKIREARMDCNSAITHSGRY